MKKQIFPLFFCFIRELNLHILLTFSLYLPIRPYLTHHPPRAFKASEVYMQSLLHSSNSGSAAECLLTESK